MDVAFHLRKSIKHRQMMNVSFHQLWMLHSIRFCDQIFDVAFNNFWFLFESVEPYPKLSS